MSVFQIWGSFPKGSRTERPTTVALFRKGQLIGDGRTMEQFERDFADDEGEELRLLREFEPVTGSVEEDLELVVANQVFGAFMDGWWRITQEER